jgi:hypothetical protein
VDHRQRIFRTRFQRSEPQHLLKETENGKPTTAIIGGRMLKWVIYLIAFLGWMFLTTQVTRLPTPFNSLLSVILWLGSICFLCARTFPEDKS